MSSRAAGTSVAVPETITGLLAWWDPAADYITRDGSDLVSAWVSREGNDYNLAQASGPAQLTWSATGIQSMPALTGAGAQYLALTTALGAALDGSAAFTVAMVVDLDATTQCAFFAVGDSANSANAITCRHSGAVTTVQSFRIDTGGNTGVSGTATLGTNPEYVSYEYDGTTWSFRVGGAAAGSGAGVRTPVCDLVSVGARRQSGAYGQYITGKIADIFVYDHVLTAGETTTLEGYITGKYVGI